MLYALTLSRCFALSLAKLVDSFACACAVRWAQVDYHSNSSYISGVLVHNSAVRVGGTAAEYKLAQVAKSDE